MQLNNFAGDNSMILSTAFILEIKLWNNQQYSALNVHKTLGVKSGAILEEILEWNGSFNEFSNEISARIP